MKANKLILFIIILLIATSGFSQGRITKKIENKCYHIELNPGKLIIKEYFYIDTLQIKSKVYKQKISSEIKFQKSKNKIKLNIYLDKNKNMMMVIAVEQSPTISHTDANKHTAIYFKDGNKINEMVAFGIPFYMVEIGVPPNVDFNEVFGCNKNLTTLYLEKLSKQIIKKIKE